ncbi:hypothetical protein LINPERHAP2_LOCUS30304 [Linum perenne]
MYHNPCRAARSNHWPQNGLVCGM